MKKFYLIFIFNLIKLNPTRSILLLLSTILLSLFFLLKNDIYLFNVENYLEENGKYYYQVSQLRNILEFDEPQKIYDDNLIKYENYSDGKVVSLIISITLLFFVIASLFIKDEGLDIEQALRDTIISDFNEICIDGEYIYRSHSKLLHRGGRITNPPFIKFKGFIKLESFYTKKEIRDNKLKKIGI